MTTTPTNSTVSAEHPASRPGLHSAAVSAASAMEALEFFAPKGVIYTAARAGQVCAHRTTLERFIAQPSDASCGASSTEPVAATELLELADAIESTGAEIGQAGISGFGNACRQHAERLREIIRRRFAVHPGQSGAKVSRYDWSKAPRWAMWAATDESGEAWFYAEKPNMSRLGWDVAKESHKSNLFDNYGSCPDWRDSLEQRPTYGHEIKNPFRSGGESP